MGPFTCHYCPKTCKTMSGLQQHYRVHEGKETMFLDKPEKVETTKYKSYDHILRQSSNRFPAYKQYLGRGKDYYNLNNTPGWYR